MKEFETKDFGLVNLTVEVDHKTGQVKIWACDPKKGHNVFRLKAMGKVYAADIHDVIVQGAK